MGEVIMESRVKVYTNLSEYQAQRIADGSPLFWHSVDPNGDITYESTDLNKVIEHANKNADVEYISCHTIGGF